MDIDILISGTLNGFSPLYASTKATEELYEKSKLDFDYRQYLGFLTKGETVYAFSFSPDLVAVSIVSRISDYFHRPGVLNVSVLIPRGKTIVGKDGSLVKEAVYDLLTRINERFYEKNYLDGGKLRTLSELKQDHYSDIIADYVLKDEPLQKRVNNGINPALRVKNVGYVKAEETDMTSYLSTPYRKNYEGYHIVFFGKNVEPNINEPVVEDVTYKVKILNTDSVLPNRVRLKDKILPIRPGRGEIDIEGGKNYTYEEVLTGKAGDKICATERDGVIEMKFNFKKKEKTILFKFLESSNVLTPEAASIVLKDATGKTYSITNGKKTFVGTEIYGEKQVITTNKNLEVVIPKTVDISSLDNDEEVTVYFKRVCDLTIKFDAPDNKPKTLIFSNGDEEVVKVNVTDDLNVKLSGVPDDWRVEITSEYYEKENIRISDYYEKKIRLTPISQQKATAYPSSRQMTESQTSVVVSENKKNLPKSSNKRNKQAIDNDEEEVETVVSGNKGNWFSEFFGSRGNGGNNNWLKYGLLAVFVIGISVVVYYLFKSPDTEIQKPQTAVMSFKFLYNDGTEVSDSILHDWNIKVYYKDKENKKRELSDVSIKSNSLIGNLEYLEDGFSLYYGIAEKRNNPVKVEKLGTIKDVIEKAAQSGGYYTYTIQTDIASLEKSNIESIKIKKVGTPEEIEETKGQTQEKERKEAKIRSEFDSEYYIPGNIMAKNDKEKEREEAVRTALTQINKLEKSVSIDGLSKNQKKAVRAYINNRKKINDTNKISAQRQLGKCENLFQVRDVMENRL